MSRRDTVHGIVRQALIREGWSITHDPYTIYSDPPLSTDLGAEKTIAAERNNQKIAIEVKSFLRGSQIAELEKAIGQYLLYRRYLRFQDPDRTLFLAVPQHAFEDVFATQVGKDAIEEFGLQLIVFSVLEDEDLLWKPT